MRTRSVVVGVIILLTTSALAVAEPWRDLAALLPESANAVLVIDAKGFFDSPLGRKRQWRESHAATFERSPLLLPPEADRFILATELDISHFEPMWEFAAITMERPVTLDEIKTRIGGVSDAIGGLSVVRTNTGGFVVPFDEGRIGLIRLAQRQWASQQVTRSRKRTSPALTTFLENAMKSVADGSAQIAIAVSTEDAVSFDEVKAAVERSTVIRRENADIDQVAKLMSNVKGFVFTVKIDETMQGRIEMQFSEDPTVLAAIAKPFMLDIIGGAGASLPEFADWNEDRTRSSVGLSGDLTIPGLRRILSLLQVDTADYEELQTDDVKSEVTKAATERYVRRVTQLFRDVATGAKASDLREQVLWTDRAAKTIARMSTRGVAPKIARIGNEVSAGLRDIVATFHYAQERAQARIVAVNPPDFETRTEFVPTRRVTTPAGRFNSRYEPFTYFQVNIAGNIARQQQITAEELTKANAEAKLQLAEADTKVRAMNDLVQQANAAK